MNSLVSVVIPTIQGREEVLDRAVKSVKEQTYEPIEILVVPEGNSACEARNIGVERAKGEFIAFLDDDDIWKPTKIEKQIQVMEEYSDCPIVTCYSKDHRFNRERIDRPPLIADQDDILNAFNYSSTSTYLCRRYSFDVCGGFDETLPSAQEYELAIRFSRHHRVRCVNEVLVEQFPTKGQISENWEKKRRGISMVYKKHEESFKRASDVNRIKIIGIICLYYFAVLLGSRIYTIINIVRKQYTESGGKKILFVHKHVNKGFIRTDYEMLSRHYEVTDFHFKSILSVPRLFLAMRKHDIVFVWFMSLHTFFTTFSSKPKVYIAGGYDVANEPSIGYGLARGGLTKFMVKRCLDRADMILTVSKANDGDLHENFGSRYYSRVVYNCPDTKFFVPNNDKKNNNLVLTVGVVNKETWVRKGIANFVDVAHYFDAMGKPYTFVVVGKIDDEMTKVVDDSQRTSKNLMFTGFVSNEELLEFYQRAKVYCQLSYYESYGLAVSEAMLCECVPVVTHNKALPEVIGEHGFKVNVHDMSGVESAIRLAMKRNGKKGREFTLKNFSMERRENALVEAIEEVINKVDN